MIKVDEVSDGVFQVVFTGIDLRSLCKAARNINRSQDETLSGLIAIVVSCYEKCTFLERSQDELDRQDEGLGRR